MSTITVSPNPATRGQTVDISGTDFDPKFKFNLSTVDDTCQEVGLTTNINRPKRNGTFSVGINLPPDSYFPSIRAYQRGVQVASVTVKAR